MSLKRSLLSVAVLLPSLGFAAPGEHKAPVDTILIPNGFDDNDHVEIVLHGEFTNSCSRISRTEFAVDPVKKEIVVDAAYYQYEKKSETAYCAQVMLPFIEVVKVGMLPEGDYSVVYSADDSVRSELLVSKAKTESPDDYLYAPVENAWLDIDPVTGRQSVVLQGTMPHWFLGCQVVKDVQIINQGNVLVVLPISEVLDDEFCKVEGYDQNFKIRKGLTAPMTTEGLLHVRTMHSNSVNRFVPQP